MSAGLLKGGRDEWDARDIYLEKAEDVGNHDGLGRETGSDHSRDGFVWHVTRRLSRFALVLRRVLVEPKIITTH